MDLQHYNQVNLSSLHISFRSISLRDLKTFSTTNSNNQQSGLNENNSSSSPTTVGSSSSLRKNQKRASSSSHTISSSSSTVVDTEIDWTRTDLPPPISGHASCVVNDVDSGCGATNSTTSSDDDCVVAIMGGISLGFKRINNVWLVSPKTLMIRKFDYIDPGAIAEFSNVANFIKPNNRKDELTYLHTYLNNLINQILREEALSNESLEASIKLFLKKKIGVQKQNSSTVLNNENQSLHNSSRNGKWNLDLIFKSYQTRMVEFLKKVSTLVFEEMSQIGKKNSQQVIPAPTSSLKFSFPIPRERHSMCTISGESKLIMMFGGIADKKIRLNDVWFLNLENMMWHEGKLKGFCKETTDNYNEYSLNKSSNYSSWIPPFTDNHNFMVKDGFTMNLGIKIPTPRYYHSMTPISDSSVLLFGGYDGSFRNDMWILNIIDKKNYIFEWKKVEYQLNSPIPSPRYNHWCGLVKEKMILFGGVLERGIQTNDVWVFDVDSFRWKNLLPDKDPSDDYPERRSDHKCVIIGKFLILVGGVHKKLYLNNTFVLDLETLKWKMFNNISNSEDKSRNLPARIGFIIQPFSSNKALIFGGIVDKDKMVARANDMWVLETNLSENSIIELRKVGFLNETRVGNYVIERLLGKGGQATVFLVRDESSIDEKHYALKRMDIVFDDNVGRNKSVASDSVFNEIFIVQQLRHVNILPTLSFFLEKRMNDNAAVQNGPVSLVLNIIMPYCESGDLSVFFVKQVHHWKRIGSWNELEIIDWLLQIASALEYIHERNIIHRDLKPSNVFVTFDKSSKEPTMKLSDFGLAKNVQTSLARTTCGTMLYLAPEIYNEDSYTEKVDIWSFGCIVAFFLLSGQLKIDLKIPTNKKKISDLLKPKENSELTLVQKLVGKEEYLQIISDCVETEPEKRPTAALLVKKLNELRGKVEQERKEKLELILTQQSCQSIVSVGHDNNVINEITSTAATTLVDNISNTTLVVNEKPPVVDEHATFEIVNEEEVITSSEHSQQDVTNMTTSIDDDEPEVLEVKIEKEETSGIVSNEENTWVEIQALLFQLEKEELLTEDQVDGLSLSVINSHVGIKRFYLALVTNNASNEGSKSSTVFKEEAAKQFKRFLKISHQK